MNDATDNDVQGNRSPLWIHPISARKLVPEELNSSTNGSYHAIQKLATQSPDPRLPEAEIETVLEAYLSPDGGCLWRRVAVWSGPATKKVMHASFILSNHSNDNQNSDFNDPSSETPLHDKPSLICWAAFPEKPKHKLLCVLVNLSTLTIWDVYPTADDSSASERVYISSEGHSVSLPFQCSAIHPLGESQGILLERKQDPEDLEAHLGSDAFQNLEIPHPELDDEFFLKMPQRKARLSTGPPDQNLFSQATGGAPLSTPRSAYTGPPAEAPSLFSLSHPLEDVLPVALHSQEEDNHDAALVTDVFEKILYSSTFRWMDNETQHQHPFCVTYNTVLKRHAIWSIKGAPPPTAMPPLWQRSRKLRSAKDFDSHLRMLDQDFDDMELLGIVDPSFHEGPTRDEALADALGVKKSARKSSLEPRARKHRVETTSGASTNRSGFLNPSRSIRDGSVLDVEMSNLDENPQLLNFGPSPNLHPNVAIECLFEESEQSSAATNAFRASNLEGSDLLVVGLLCPTTPDGQEENPNTLRLFAIEPSPKDKEVRQNKQSTLGSLGETLDHFFSVNLISTIECLAAEAIESTPGPVSSKPFSSKSNCATDILVLQGSDSQSTLTLYRSSCLLTSCALPAGSLGGRQQDLIVRGIKNPVRGMLDFITDEYQVRGHVSLVISSSALAEKVLSAIESAIPKLADVNSRQLHMEFALKLRADCRRREQTLQQEHKRLDSCVDASWLAVDNILNSVMQQECVGLSNDSSNWGNEKSSKEDASSAWTTLLSSPFHSDFTSKHADALYLGNQSTTKTGLPNASSTSNLQSEGTSVVDFTKTTGYRVANTIFDTMHLIYEDCKLSSDSNRVDRVRKIGSFLVRTCYQCLRVAESPLMLEFLHHYNCDLGASFVEEIQKEVLAQQQPQPSSPVTLTTFESPPNVLKWADSLIRQLPAQSFYDTSDLSAINSACRKTKSLVRIFKILFEQDENISERDFRVLSVLSEEGFQTAQQVRDELPPGLALPILEALNRCSENPDKDRTAKWKGHEFSLIERHDLGCNNGQMSLRACTKQKTKATQAVVRRNADNPSFADKDKDGLVPLQLSSAMLFPTDNRIKEAGRLLRSSKPVFLFVERAIEVSDHEHERIKQNKLLLLCRRTLALSVGRGMMTIGGFEPVAAEPLPIPDLCLVGRVPPANANLALDMSECQSGFKIWPEFHNGCAAGLRLPLAGESNESISRITRSWIVYNRPTRLGDSQTQNPNNGQPPAVQSQSHAHGGLLLALGLRGHLSALEMTDIYDYLTQGQVTLTCGVLLGMAASKRGTCDISVSKMLCLHLPSLIPQHFSAIDVASPVQSAAVTGAGLLFQGSSHRMMTEFLLNEIGRRPESDVTLDREAYTLSCGIALGMVNLCKGDRVAGKHAGEGLDDLHIAERLYRYIVGGTDDEEGHRTREANDRQNIPAASSTGENERCSCVFEGDAINIDVTAGGATLALGLIFLRSGNRNIASAIELPSTHFLLEYVRPDFLALRVISRALILWDTVEPSGDWIAKQLPVVVKEAYKQMELKMKSATDFTLDGDMADDRSNQKEVRFNTGADSHLQDYDCQAVRQIYTFVIAGACFALGLRYAGTCDKSAAAAIFERVVELQTLRDANDSVSLALRPEAQILETCLGCCAISLAMVQAGSGDLVTLKLFKILRWRCDEQVKYGAHMAYSIAIGLLFLGGGTCTLDRSPEAIAALVAAFFPRFPITTADNQYHLQALRHLYALAVKRRDIRFIDVDSGEVVPLEVEIKYRDKSLQPLRLKTPCLFPNGDGDAQEVRIISDQYYPLKLELQNATLGRKYYVKRRTQTLVSTSDIHLQQALLVRFSTFKDASFDELVKSLTGNAYMRAFAKYIVSAHPSSTKAQHGLSVEEFCKAALLECVSGCTDLTLPIYLRLRTALSLIEGRSCSSNLIAWDFHLMRSFYETSSSTASSLLNTEKVAYLLESAERNGSLQGK